MKNGLDKLLIAFLVMILSGLITFNFISAAEVVNYSVNSNYDGIQVSSLKYDPYPANPGDYVDVWIQADIGTSVRYAKFEVLDSFPFSIDSSENPIREYTDFSGDVVMHYKVRVDKDAVEGVNQLKIKIYSGPSSSGSVYSMDIDVAQAQTDFDLVVQDSTSSEVSLAIANIGKTTANSMIVRIPEQDGYKVSGTNGQMIGNLESGDYTVTSFSLAQVGRNPGNLKVQIDYTDSIGVRRSVIKEVQFGSQSSGNFSGTTRNFSGTTRNFSGGNFPTAKKNTNAKWYIIGGTGVLVIAIVGILIYSRNKKKKHMQKKNLKDEDSDSEVPGWIKKVKEKERK